MKVFDCFFMLGKKNTPPRALSYQQALGREITVIEKMDMHLLYSKDKILIKPLPKYLLEPKFWEQYLECPEECPYNDMFTAFRRGGQLHHSHRLTKLKPCNHSVIWMRALGFAFSYVGLVCTRETLRLQRRTIWSQTMSTLKTGSILCLGCSVTAPAARSSGKSTSDSRMANWIWRASTRFS